MCGIKRGTDHDNHMDILTSTTFFDAISGNVIEFGVHVVHNPRIMSSTECTKEP
jgi:hypothetical protein